MTKLKDMIHLDYVTIKPYFTTKDLLLLSAMALFLTAMSANMSSGMGAGLMVATLFVGYPFALSDKNNLDALYTTLSIRRKSVVQGRYLFTLLLNIGAVLFSLVLAAAGLLIAKLAGFSSGSGSEGYFASTLLLSASFILVQAIQLPLFFKFGYAKAKILGIVPFIALMAGYMAFMTMRNMSAGLANSLTRLVAGGMLIPLLIVGLAIVVLVSYQLSMAFYAKREF